jgi:hypothetical protein
MLTRNQQSQIKSSSEEGTCVAAVSSTQASTDRPIEERLQRRFGLSRELARALADLMDQHAGLLSEEARCG